MNAFQRLSAAARMSQLLKQMMTEAFDREKILAQIKDLEEGCRVFGIPTQGKTVGRLKLELKAAIDKELGR